MVDGAGFQTTELRSDALKGESGSDGAGGERKLLGGGIAALTECGIGDIFELVGGGFADRIDLGDEQRAVGMNGTDGLADEWSRRRRGDGLVVAVARPRGVGRDEPVVVGAGG